MKLTLILISILIGLYVLVSWEKRRIRKASLEAKRFLEERAKYTLEQFESDLVKNGFDSKHGISLAKAIHKYMDDNDPDLPQLYPMLSDDLNGVWGIHEEKAEILNDMFKEHDSEITVKWNSKEILDLGTTEDLLKYFRIKVKA